MTLLPQSKLDEIRERNEKVLNDLRNSTGSHYFVPYKDKSKKEFDNQKDEWGWSIPPDFLFDAAQLLNMIDELQMILREIKAHGCCVMHNDNGCPGCKATETLREIRGDE